MTSARPSGLLLSLALVASLLLATPAFSQSISARTSQIIELIRAGKYAEALPLAQAALAEAEKAHGPVHRDVAAALNNLGQVHGSLGKDDEAEPLYKRALAMFEKTGGLDSPDVAPTLNNLAALYQRQERFADAEPLFRRALAIRERTLGASHPDTGQSINNLATLLEKQGRRGESEPLFRRALAIYEKAVGPEHPAVATLLNNLGQVAKAGGRYGEAEPLIKRSLAIREKVLGQDHSDVARSLNNLADLYERQRRYTDAEPLYRRALAIRERAVGFDHPETATSANNLAYLLRLEDRTADALPLVSRLIAGGRAQPRVALSVLFDARQKDLLPAERAFDDGLNVVQRGAQSSAASAVNKLAVRLAAGNDRLAELVRQDQDLGAEADRLDKSLMTAVSKDRSKRDPAAEQRGRDRVSVIVTERARLQKTLSVEFPDYSALSNPLPLTARDIQSLLSNDEAMVRFALAEKESYVFAITRDSFAWTPIPIGADALSDRISAFRRGLDIAQASDASGKSDLFDLARAHDLYATLLAPVEPLIRDKRSLLVVPSGPLTALPFHLLITEKPVMAIPDELKVIAKPPGC